MGMFKVDGKLFVKCIPSIFKVTFSSPVKHGIIFYKLLDELIKKQIFVNEKGEEMYNRTGMKDENGHNVAAFVDRDGGQIRSRTGHR
jgi:hypothetical protein